MPTVVMVGGPNGAGKTSFAREWLAARGEGFKFVNADDIARELASSGLSGDRLDAAAAREMLSLIASLTVAGRDMLVETTLATRSYARRIRGWQDVGFRVELMYLTLPTVDHAIQRVAQRVAAGGHHIPEEVIRRRFDLSKEYLDQIYRPLVDAGQIWTSSAGEAQLVESWP